MIDLLVTLWDSKQGGFNKVTKNSGSDKIENPWINMIACTTPGWIAGNFPKYVIEGGFTSRCLFVYTDKKEKLVAYPIFHIPPGMLETQAKLAADLEHIATTLVGPYHLCEDKDNNARKWGEDWYDYHYAHPPAHLQDNRFGGYLARKQTHVHKLAMIIAASQRDELIISLADLELAATMVTDLETDMPKVFASIGRTEDSIQAERFVEFVRKNSPTTYMAAYKYVHAAFPFVKDYEGIVAGAVQAGLIKFDQTKFVLTKGD